MADAAINTEGSVPPQAEVGKSGWATWLRAFKERLSRSNKAEKPVPTPAPAETPPQIPVDSGYAALIEKIRGSGKDPGFVEPAINELTKLYPELLSLVDDGRTDIVTAFNNGDKGVITDLARRLRQKSIGNRDIRHIKSIQLKDPKVLTGVLAGQLEYHMSTLISEEGKVGKTEIPSITPIPPRVEAAFAHVPASRLDPDAH